MRTHRPDGAMLAGVCAGERGADPPLSPVEDCVTGRGPASGGVTAEPELPDVTSLCGRPAELAERTAPAPKAASRLLRLNLALTLFRCAFACQPSSLITIRLSSSMNVCSSLLPSLRRSIILATACCSASSSNKATRSLVIMLRAFWILYVCETAIATVIDVIRAVIKITEINATPDCFGIRLSIPA